MQRKKSENFSESLSLSLFAKDRTLLKRKRSTKKFTDKKQRAEKEVKELNMYQVRKEICEGNDVHCLAFTAPLMDLG